MPALHDMICGTCGEVAPDMPLYVEGSKCPCLKGTMEILWSAPSRNAAAISGSEVTVVYQHPKTGKIIYPGRNDRPMPSRYAQAGFERKEIRSLREMDRFSEKHGVVNEAAHYDRGSGRSYDNEPGRR